MDAETLGDEMLQENKYKGYKISELSESLGNALNQDNQIVPSWFGSYLHYFDSIDWMTWVPSLHTALVMVYFLLLVCILGGISSFMWKKFDIKGKSQSNNTSLENQLLGTGKYAQYVNAAVAFKIYQQEMAKEDDSDTDDDDDDDDDSDDNGNDSNTIHASTLIGGYHKTKKLRARTIRKQQLREQKENYQRYKKRLEYEKQLKRYKKKKEKKAAKKSATKLRAQRKNNKRKNETDWMHSMYDSFTSWLGHDETNGTNEIDTSSDVKKAHVKKNTSKANTNQVKRNDRKHLEEMIKHDCCNEIVIDLEKYYVNKIKASDVYCKIIRDMKALIKMIKSLSAKHKECEGLVDSNGLIYFRWNKKCEQELVRWIQDKGECDVHDTGEQMLAISKSIFKH
eukprot:700794_1